MALACVDAALHALERSTAMPAIAPFTVLFWHRPDANLAAVTTFFRFGGGGVGGYRLGYNTSGLLFSVRSEGHTTVTGSAMTVGTWAHLGLSVSGTGTNQALGYFNGVLDVTQNGNNSATTLLALSTWAYGSTEQDEGSYAAFKFYTRALSAPEIAMEMRYYTPLSTDGLLIWSPWRDEPEAVVDYTSSLNWTLQGTFATTDGPPIAWSRSLRGGGMAMAGAIADQRWPFPPPPTHFWRRR